MKVTDDYGRLIPTLVQEAVDKASGQKTDPDNNFTKAIDDLKKDLDKITASLYGSVEKLEKRVEKLEKPVKKVVSPRKVKVEKLVEKADKALEDGKVDAKGYMDIIKGKEN